MYSPKMSVEPFTRYETLRCDFCGGSGIHTWLPMIPHLAWCGRCFIDYPKYLAPEELAKAKAAEILERLHSRQRPGKEPQ